MGETDHIIFIQSDLAVSDQESFGFHDSVYRNHFFPNLAPEHLWRYQSVINITDDMILLYYYAVCHNNKSHCYVDYVITDQHNHIDLVIEDVACSKTSVMSID